MLVMVIEGELDEPPQGIHRGQALGVEFRLAFAHEAVGVLEGAQIEPLLVAKVVIDHALAGARARRDLVDAGAGQPVERELARGNFQDVTPGAVRSEEHTSELQSLMRISYAVFCLKKNTKITQKD